MPLRVKSNFTRARSEPGGTRWRTGVEVKGKLANGVGSQYSQATSERGLSTITKAAAYTSAARSRLTWRPHRFKWTRPFRGKTNSGFCACAITFRTSCTFSECWNHTSALEIPQSLAPGLQRCEQLWNRSSQGLVGCFL